MAVSEEKIEEVVDKIVEDMVTRHGLQNVWEQIDDDIQSEIKAKWRSIVAENLKGI